MSHGARISRGRIGTAGFVVVPRAAGGGTVTDNVRERCLTVVLLHCQFAFGEDGGEPLTDTAVGAGRVGIRCLGAPRGGVGPCASSSGEGLGRRVLGAIECGW